jgi:hypothetical protein
VHLGVDELAGGIQVDQAPMVIAAHRVGVAAAQEARVGCLLLQIVEALRKPVQQADMQFDGALELLAAIDEQGLLVALVLERDSVRIPGEGEKDSGVNVKSIPG